MVAGAAILVMRAQVDSMGDISTAVALVLFATGVVVFQVCVDTIYIYIAQLFATGFVVFQVCVGI